MQKRHIDQNQRAVFVYLAKKALFVAKIGLNDVRNVTKALHYAEVATVFSRLGVYQKRYVLTGVIGRGRGGIATVICRDNEQIVLAKNGQKLTQTSVELGQRARIAVNVISMTEHHIEIHEIDKAKSREISICDGKRLVHTVRIGNGGIGLGNANACENIVYLTHGNDLKALALQSLKHSFLGRKQGIVVSSRKSLEGVFSAEGTGDNSAHAMLTN